MIVDYTNQIEEMEKYNENSSMSNFEKIPKKKLEKRTGHDLELYNRAMKKREFRMMMYNNRFGKRLKMSL